MAELGTSTKDTESSAPAAGGGGRSTDEVALELMKFVAVASGYGKATQSTAGFSGKPTTRTVEEHAEALLELFQRCRKAVKQDV